MKYLPLDIKQLAINQSINPGIHFVSSYIAVIFICLNIKDIRPLQISKGRNKFPLSYMSAFFMGLNM